MRIGRDKWRAIAAAIGHGDYRVIADLVADLYGERHSASGGRVARHGKHDLVFADAASGPALVDDGSLHTADPDSGREVGPVLAETRAGGIISINRAEARSPHGNRIAGLAAPHAVNGPPQLAALTAETRL
jgi:hypothetical protein